MARQLLQMGRAANSHRRKRRQYLGGGCRPAQRRRPEARQKPAPQTANLLRRLCPHPRHQAIRFQRNSSAGIFKWQAGTQS